MDNPFKSPAVISFCPGILGIERGLKRAGVKPRVVAYVEIEAFIIANLVAGMEAGILDPAPIWTDAKSFDARPFRGRIHGLIGGYPCTPFSLAGTRSGEDHPGHIYPAISRAIEATRPLWCFFENVDDHLSLGFDKVYQDLQRMGYAVETGIYTAEEVGAPHERERLFILAISNGKELADGDSGRCGKKRIGRSMAELRTEWSNYKLPPAKCGGELVNPTSLTKRKQADEINTKPEQGETRQESGQRCEQLADEVGQGLEIGREQSTWKEQQAVKRSSIDQFPARPGENQHAWEEPRTIESGMGSTIDGYNFREDLLRALGNSVVEQTAELAFIDLLNKHLKNV